MLDPIVAAAAAESGHPSDLCRVWASIMTDLKAKGPEDRAYLIGIRSRGVDSTMDVYNTVIDAIFHSAAPGPDKTYRSLFRINANVTKTSITLTLDRVRCQPDLLSHVPKRPKARILWPLDAIITRKD